MSGPAPIPPDPALPQIRSLLDPGAMSSVLGRSLVSDPTETDVRIRYLRYRPEKSIVVGYAVADGTTDHDAFAWAASATDLAARAAAPESRSLVEKLDGRAPTPMPLDYDPSLDALVQWLPLDLALPAMAEPPEVLRARVAAAGLELGADDLPRTVKHKPMTRGVLRFDQHIAKIYPDTESFEASVRSLDASASLPFPTARRTAVVPELLMVTQSLVPGRRPEAGHDTAVQAGAILAVLHRSPSEGLPVERPRDDLRRTARQARMLATVVPELASRLDVLLERLASALPEADLVPSHGGFHASQLLEADGELGVVDFDGMCLAPAARDLASYAASQVERPDDVEQAAETLEVLVGAYGQRPPGLEWYLAKSLVGRARRPFARFSDSWPAKVEERVAAAEAALELG